jgi:hypothetical protein
LHDIGVEGSEYRRVFTGASRQDIALPRHEDTAFRHEPVIAECAAGALRWPS